MDVSCWEGGQKETGNVGLSGACDEDASGSSSLSSSVGVSSPTPAVQVQHSAQWGSQGSSGASLFLQVFWLKASFSWFITLEKAQLYFIPLSTRGTSWTPKGPKTARWAPTYACQCVPIFSGVQTFTSTFSSFPTSLIVILTRLSRHSEKAI